MYILFLFFLNLHAYALPPPFSVAENSNCPANEIPILDEPAAVAIYGECYSVPNHMAWSHILILIVIGIRREITPLYRNLHASLFTANNI